MVFFGFVVNLSDIKLYHFMSVSYMLEVPAVMLCQNNIGFVHHYQSLHFDYYFVVSVTIL